MVLAQYYNFVRLGTRRLHLRDEADAAERPGAGGQPARQRPVRGDRRRRGAAAAGGLPALGRAHHLRRVRHRLAAVRGARLDGAGVHPPPQRREGEDHAGAGEGDHEPRTGRTADPRHRGRLRDPRREGRSPPDRARADQDGHRLLTAPGVRPRGRFSRPPRAACGAGVSAWSGPVSPSSRPTGHASCFRPSNGPTNRGPESRVSSQRASRRNGCARY